MKILQKQNNKKSVHYSKGKTQIIGNATIINPINLFKNSTEHKSYQTITIKISIIVVFIMIIITIITIPIHYKNIQIFNSYQLQLILVDLTSIHLR